MKDITMLERYDRAMDMDANHEWGQEDISRIPDIVVIFLGSNDFSTGKQPRMRYSSKDIWNSSAKSGETTGRTFPYSA